MQKQIEASEPEKHILKDTIASIKNILEHAVGGIVAGTLLALLHVTGGA